LLRSFLVGDTAEPEPQPRRRRGRAEEKATFLPVSDKLPALTAVAAAAAVSSLSLSPGSELPSVHGTPPGRASPLPPDRSAPPPQDRQGLLLL